jgi:hypothetical protein
MWGQIREKVSFNCQAKCIVLVKQLAAYPSTKYGQDGEEVAYIEYSMQQQNNYSR